VSNYTVYQIEIFVKNPEHVTVPVATNRIGIKNLLFLEAAVISHY